MKNPFDVLDLPATATPQAIKSKFRELALQTHPDKLTGGNDPFVELKEAYDQLQDPVSRRTWAEKKNNSTTEDPHARHRVPGRVAKVEEIQKKASAKADFNIDISFEESFSPHSKLVSYTSRVRCTCIKSQLAQRQEDHSDATEMALYGCNRCNFSGIRSQKKELRVYIPAGVHTGFNLPITERHASQTACVRVTPPDSPQYEPFAVQRKGNDLFYIYGKTLSAIDAVSVAYVNLRLPNNTGLKVNVRDALAAKMCHSGRNCVYRSTLRVRDAGFMSVDKRFPRGMLYILIPISTLHADCFPRSDSLISALGAEVEKARCVRGESCFPPMDDKTRVSASEEPSGCVQQ